MSFISLDAETSNADMSSICSIGIAIFEKGALASQWYSLVDPQDYFDPVNTSIHSIKESDVQNAPTFEDLSDDIRYFLDDRVVVTHTHFDRVAMQQAANRWSTQLPAATWLDSANVARRTWTQCARSGYGLAKVCKMLDYTFQHHNALEDAKAAGHIILAAMRETGLELDALLKRVKQPIVIGKPATTRAAGKSIKRNGAIDGPLSGEVIVFTGRLEIPRHEAADIASSIGCSVENSITKKTTILVVGDVDIQRLAGHKKSSKHRKAEELIIAGSPIRIIRETDFKNIVALH